MENVNVNDAAKLLKICASIMLENGGETYRVEETINLIGNSLGFDTDIIAIPTGIFITVGNNDGHVNTSIKRISKRSVDLSVINTVNNISRQIVKEELTFEESLTKLQNLYDKKSEVNSLYVLSAASSSGFFAFLSKGSLFDCLVSALCGVLVRYMLNKIEINDVFNFAVNIISGIIISTISIIFVTSFNMGNLDKIITGSITPLLPGLSMTTAIRDAMRGDLLSGVGRAAEAMLTAIALAFGVGVALSIHYSL